MNALDRYLASTRADYARHRAVARRFRHIPEVRACHVRLALLMRDILRRGA